ncbi:MAG TPA: CoA-binding protein [Bryobacteraceae bacterium]|nr:CoA-binding protein [Bryobacteraceae bacterium]
MTPGEILRRYRKIAVVGISNNRTRASNGVSRYMLGQGYEIVPVNPAITEFEGIAAVPDLASAPADIEIVNIFRRPEYVPEIVEAAIAKGAKVIWMQQGIVHEEAAERARKAGLEVVQDRCILVEHMAQKHEG